MLVCSVLCQIYDSVGQLAELLSRECQKVSVPVPLCVMETVVELRMDDEAMSGNLQL